MTKAEAWNSLPTTKVRRPPTEGPFAWTYTYTAFSVPFASAALDLLGARPDKSVLDPFVGSGTTVLAAAAHGCKALGVDVSPFSSLLTRARLALGVDPERVRSYLSASLSQITPQEAPSKVLGAENSVYAESVVTAISSTRKLAPKQLWNELLADDTGTYDSESVALLSLAIGARDCAKLARGSNPAWYSRLSETAELPTASLRHTAMAWAKVICGDLADSPLIARAGCRVTNADMTRTDLPQEFDICLTSPPYLNRFDYVVAHLPELSVLELVAPVSMGELRRSMIGTTTMVSKNTNEIPSAWGPVCLKTLGRVLNHSSYASRRYYYHNYFLYFERLYKALEKTLASLRRGGEGVAVLQDSFYKDVNIPTPNIFVEMLRSLSCSAEIARTTAVRTNMGRMSPHQNVYVPGKTFVESLVHFRRA